MPDPAAKLDRPPIPAADLNTPVIKGPLRSERLGATLGIDIGYAENALSVSRENRMPRASIVITTAARGIIRLSKSGEKVESIAAVGTEMDPTLHPDFKEITGNLRDLRNKWFPKAKLWLQSDDAHLEAPNVLRVRMLEPRKKPKRKKAAKKAAKKAGKSAAGKGSARKSGRKGGKKKKSAKKGR